MSRTILCTLAISLAFAVTAKAEWICQNPHEPIQLVSFDDDQPNYEDLVKQLEETKAELDATYQRLDAAYETAERYATEDELEEFRDATRWDRDDSVMRSEYNYAREGDTGGPGGDMGDMATQSQNPVGGLWMMWFQNDMKLMEGPLGGKRIFNTTVFQPVMPIQLSEDWKVINRPVFMWNTFEAPVPFNFRPGGSQDPVQPPSAPFDTDSGLGDIAFIQWLSNSPSSSKMVTGVGWNWMFPAASQQSLGTGRTSLGPSVGERRSSTLPVTQADRTGPLIRSGTSACTSRRLSKRRIGRHEACLAGTAVAATAARVAVDHC